MAMMQLQRRQTYSQAATANVRRDTGGGGYTVHAMGVDTRTNKASLFAGTADGHVSAWHMESASSNDKPWATFAVKPRCGLKVMEYIKDYNVLLTGSTDGTMAIWDPWTRSKSNADSFLCIQNLVGHVSSVTDATYLDDCIVSSGTDLTINFGKWRVAAKCCSIHGLNVDNPSNLTVGQPRLVAPCCVALTRDRFSLAQQMVVCTDLTAWTKLILMIMLASNGNTNL